jgi:hypothetical protein
MEITAGLTNGFALTVQSSRVFARGTEAQMALVEQLLKNLEE